MNRSNHKTLKKILIIDDNSFIITLIRQILEKARFEVFSCESGERGLEIANQLHPDLVLLDLRLPGIDGHTVLRNLKLSNQTKNVPVVMLSGDNNMRQIIRCIFDGADDYVLKPFKGSIMVKKISDLLSGRRAPKRKDPDDFFLIG